MDDMLMHCETLQEMEALGMELSEIISLGDVVYLKGDLGAGKTTLVQFILKAMGYKGFVKSPTYSIIEPYTMGDFKIYHCDLYRFEDPEALYFLGLEDMLDGKNIFFIEWPEKGEGVLPRAHYCIDIQYSGTEEKVTRILEVKHCH